MRFPGTYGGALLVVVFGILASVAVFAQARRAESRAREADFRLLARDRVLAVRGTVETRFEDVHSLRALFNSSEDVSRAEFAEFSRDLLSHAEGLQALEWIPRVPHSRRADFELRARADGLPDFEFREQAVEMMTPAEPRAEYFPVFYVEPLAGNEPALGFDLASDPTRYEAIRNCIETGQPATTARVDLVQDDSEQHGVLVFFPVFDGAEVRGLVLGVLRVGTLLSHALSQLQERPIDVALFDVTEPDAPAYLARARGAELLSERGTADLASAPARELIRVADRTWMVVAQPADGYEHPAGNSWSVAFMLVGLIATASLAWFLVHRARNEQRVRRYERELAHLARVATTGELAASIAHEMNQPLCAIVLNAQAAKRLADGDRQELTGVLDRIVKDGERAGDTIRNLREYLRDGETVQRPTDLAAIVKEAVRLFSATDNREHPLEVWIQPGLPSVVANEVQIQQVMLNLIRNAADAVDAAEGADLLISVSVEVDDSRHVVTSVDDAGPGIDSDARAQVFAPFFTTKEQGMGMGLSICKTIIESHGGKIWVTPSRAGGARFSFSLPSAYRK